MLKLFSFGDVYNIEYRVSISILIDALAQNIASNTGLMFINTF